ncbi:terpene synthase family protein [Nocardia sp. NPDC001965]
MIRIAAHVDSSDRPIEQAILDWAEEFRLLDNARSRERLARTHLGELVARSYPRIDPARIHAVAGWFTWAFVIDDCYDNPVGGYDAAVAGMVRTLTPDGSAAPAPASRLDALLAQVWSAPAADRSPFWRMRFTQHMIHFVTAFKYEGINRARKHTPSLLGYTQLRRVSGGITPSLDLLEVAVDREVSPLLHETEQLHTMFNRSADVVVWVNDVVSLSKELAAGETTNGVLVLAKERGLDNLQDAVDAVYSRVAEQMIEFFRVGDELEQLASTWLGLEAAEIAALDDYVSGMRSWMRGNLDWSDHCDRYLVADGVRLTTDPTLVTP